MRRNSVRAFAPPSFCVGDEVVKCMIESRLEHSGEWARHIPKDGDPQWVVINYQYIPEPQQLSGEYKLSAANPVAYGLLDHFEVCPENYREGNSVKTESGSCFEVRGLLYSVKCVEIKHRCNLRVELCQMEKCAEPRPGFFEEVEGLQCEEKRNCVDIF